MSWDNRLRLSAFVCGELFTNRKDPNFQNRPKGREKTEAGGWETLKELIIDVPFATSSVGPRPCPCDVWYVEIRKGQCLPIIDRTKRYPTHNNRGPTYVLVHLVLFIARVRK